MNHRKNKWEKSEFVENQMKKFSANEELYTKNSDEIQEQSKNYCKNKNNSKIKFEKIEQGKDLCPQEFVTMKKLENEKYKVKVLKYELLNLTNLLKDKDKQIENLVKNIQDLEKNLFNLEKSSKENLRSLAIPQLNLSEKSKNSENLEISTSDIKNESKNEKKSIESNSEIKKNLSEMLTIIESQDNIIKEINYENSQWKKISKLLFDYNLESLQINKEEENLEFFNDCEKSKIIIIKMKNLCESNKKLLEKQNKKIEKDEKKQRDYESQIFDYEEKLIYYEKNKSEVESKIDLHKKILEKNKKILCEEYSDIIDEFLKFLESNPKKFAVFASKFSLFSIKEMIKLNNFSDVIVNLISFFNEMFKTNRNIFLCDEFNETNSRIPPLSRSQIPLPQQKPEKRLEKIENSPRLSIWTQTIEPKVLENSVSSKEILKKVTISHGRRSLSPEIKHKISASLSLLGLLTNEKAVQAPDSQSVNSNSEKPPIKATNFTANPKDSIKACTKPILLTEDEDFSSLMEKSRKMIAKIDRQNVRLAKINTDILKIAPNEEREAGRNEICETAADFDQSQENGFVEDLYCIDQNSHQCSPQRKNSEKKRSGWNFSALATPLNKSPEPPSPEIINKKPQSPGKKEKIVRSKARSKSPEANFNRFTEYQRPLFKHEVCYENVAEFFNEKETA